MTARLNLDRGDDHFLWALVERAATGDPDARQSLTEWLTRRMVWMARPYQLDDDEAADVIHNVWAPLLNNPRVIGIETLLAWLTAAIRREVLRVLDSRPAREDCVVNTNPGPAREGGVGDFDLEMERFRDQVERSSLGTPGAKRLRARVPESILDKISSRIAPAAALPEATENVAGVRDGD